MYLYEFDELILYFLGNNLVKFNFCFLFVVVIYNLRDCIGFFILWYWCDKIKLFLKVV